MRATWYMLEDGTPVDPSEVTRDEGGALVHESGKIAIGDHGNYRTTGVDVDERTGKLLVSGNGDHDGSAPSAGEKPSESDADEAKDLKADKPKGGYKTRESKAKG